MEEGCRKFRAQESIIAWMARDLKLKRVIMWFKGETTNLLAHQNTFARAESKHHAKMEPNVFLVHLSQLVVRKWNPIVSKGRKSLHQLVIILILQREDAGMVLPTSHHASEAVHAKLVSTA